MKGVEAADLLQLAKRSRARAQMVREQTWFEFPVIGAAAIVTVVLRAVAGYDIATAFAGAGLTMAAVAIVVRERRRRRLIGEDNVPFIHVASVAEAAAIGIAAKSTYLDRVFYELTPARALVVAGVLVAAVLAFALLRRRTPEVIIATVGCVAVAGAYTQVPDAVWPVAVASIGTLVGVGIAQRLEVSLAR